MVSSQTFHEHIVELRHRILWVFLVVSLSATLGYFLRVRLISLLQHPLHEPLFYNSPAGSFNFVIKISMLIGVFLALPVMVYHLLRFLEPALPVRIKKGTMVKVILSSFVLALSGVAFAYYYMIPMSLHFFATYSTDVVKPLISATEYLNYITNSLLTFALVFQIPLIILFINWIKPVKPSKLLKYQRHIVVGALGLAVILPFTYDPISQFIFALPIVVLYYLSIGLVWVANRKRAYKQTTDNAPVVSMPSVPTARPALSIPQTVAPIYRPRLSLDGFVAMSPKKQPAFYAPMPARTKLPSPRQEFVVPKTTYHKAGRPGFSIDGISPALT